LIFEIGHPSTIRFKLCDPHASGLEFFRLALYRDLVLYQELFTGFELTKTHQ
jgi:hypothetical protein